MLLWIELVPTKTKNEWETILKHEIDGNSNCFFYWMTISEGGEPSWWRWNDSDCLSIQEWISRCRSRLHIRNTSILINYETDLHYSLRPGVLGIRRISEVFTNPRGKVFDPPSTEGRVSICSQNIVIWAVWMRQYIGWIHTYHWFNFIGCNPSPLTHDQDSVARNNSIGIKLNGFFRRVVKFYQYFTCSIS